MAATITDGTDVSTVVRTNVIQDPAALVSAGWSIGGLGTPAPAAPETMVTGATDGPILPDGTMLTSYARYTLGGPTGTGASPYLLTSNVAGGNYQGDFPVGLGVGTCLYMRTSVAGSWYARRWSYLAGAASGTQQAAPVAVPANTWVRLDHFANLTAPADYFRASVMGPSLVSGQTVDVTAAMVTPDVDAVGPWFYGGSPADGDLSYRFAGAANASASQEILTVPNAATPDLVTDYGYGREARTIVHPVLGASASGLAVPDVTLRAPTTRTGMLAMLCATRETATDVEAMHLTARTLTLTVDDEPTANMAYVATGPMAVEYDADADVWWVRVTYAEVAA